MLKISVLELFVAVIPEAFIFIFGVYILSNIPFNYKRIAISGLAAGLATYIIRLLPLFPGANMIFVILVSTALLVLINKIYIIQAVSSFLILMVIRIITEWLNLLTLIKLFNFDTTHEFVNPISKTLSFLPSIVLFFLIVVVIYAVKRKKTQVSKDVSD